ncbi:MAG: rhomboid family intramembrane serine protease [Cyclobacteriaceae bacterium]
MAGSSVGLSILVPARFVFFMWLVFILEGHLDFNIKFLGIYPRTVWGLAGILFAPFIHGDLRHLVSNTAPVLFLGATLYFFYGRIAGKVFYLCFFATNILVWLFGRPSMHIGASGLIYGLASFLIFFGLFRKDFISLLISVVIVLLYGGMMYGILPMQTGVSWESHLFGAVVGAIAAMQYSRVKKVAM